MEVTVTMRKVLLTSAIVVLGLSVAMSASAFTKTMVRDSAGHAPSSLATDCTLASGNNCAGWVWVFNDVQGAVWGTVLNPADCAGGCVNGGAVTSITMRSYCNAAPAPGAIDDLGLSAVDGVGCRTGSPLYSTGPITVAHCASGDRWTTFAVPTVHVAGHPFAVTVTWGPHVGASANPQFSTEAQIANLYCHQNPGVYPVFPGCGTSTADCTGWSMPPQRTYLYETDVTGDGIPDDICALYGVPYALAFPYVYGYGYLPNNLMITVGLDCSSPTATEAGSWGHVKSLYQ